MALRLRTKWLLLFLLCLLPMAAQAQTPSPKQSVPPQKLPSSPKPSASPFVVNATITIVPTPSPSPSPVVEPKLDKPGWTYWFPPVLQALIGVGGAILAIWQFNRAHKQRDDDMKLREKDMIKREEQFTTAQANALQQFADKQKQDKELAETKAAQDKLATARKEIQDQFVDMQNRFEKTDAAVKVSAALRLAEFAEKLDPKKEPKVGEAYPPRSSEFNRYFIPVAQQLASALVLEEKVAVRNAIRDALKRMTLFAAREKDDGQVLLHELIAVLAESNRRAKDAFIVAFAEWAGAKETPELTDADIDLVAQVTAFCAKRENTVSCLRALMVEKEPGATEYEDNTQEITKMGAFARARAVYRAKRLGMEEGERAKTYALLLPRLETTAQQLTDIRDALVMALGEDALATPADFPMKKLEEALTLPNPSPEGSALGEWWQTAVKTIKEMTWTRMQALPLSECFFAGANLHSAQLLGADLSHSLLHEASLNVAQLQMANLNYAKLWGADLWKIQLQGAMLQRTDLGNANLNEARLQGADITMTQWQGADLSSAQLQGANLMFEFLSQTILNETQLQGADLSMAQLQKANLESADLQGAILYEAEMSSANLSNAWLQGAKLSKAQLQGATLNSTQLQGADLSNANLQGAKLIHANLENANLSNAELQGADLTNTHLYKTNLYGVYIADDPEVYWKTIFTNSSWNLALFAPVEEWMRNAKTDQQMVALQKWLKQFTPMSEDEVVPYTQEEMKTAE